MRPGYRYQTFIVRCALSSYNRVILFISAVGLWGWVDFSKNPNVFDNWINAADPLEVNVYGREQCADVLGAISQGLRSLGGGS